MNKNTEVLLTEYDSASSTFTKIYEVYNIEYAPYILKNLYNEKDFNDNSFRINLSKSGIGYSWGFPGVIN